MNLTASDRLADQTREADLTGQSRKAEVTTLFGVAGADLDALHDRLAATAEDRRLLEIAYRTIDTRIGPLLLAATEQGLVRVAFACEGFDAVVAELAAKIGPRLLEAPRRLDPIATELDEYFAGKRQVFEVPLDYTLSSGFRQTVQRHLPHIGYGHTQSYREVAESVGHPKASRAVGTACATNPLPIVLPCHRVLRSDGTLGGYRGGLEAKTTLLDLERAA